MAGPTKKKRSEQPTYERLLRQEEFIVDVTEALAKALDARGMSKSDLAKELQKSKSFVSQILGGGRNLTLRTIADVSEVLGFRPTMTFTDKHPTEDERESSSWKYCGRRELPLAWTASAWSFFATTLPSIADAPTMDPRALPAERGVGCNEAMGAA